MADLTYARRSTSPTIAYDARMATWGGVGTYALELLRALVRDRDAADLSFLALRRPADAFLEELPELAPVRWVTVDGDPLDPRGALTAGLAARRACADLYHATHLTIPLGFDGPLVTTIHDLIPLLAPESMPSRVQRTAYRQTVLQAVRRSAVILTVSRFTAETLYQMGFAPRSIVVTHNGVDPRFAPRSADAVDTVRTMHGLPRDYVLWLGGFKPHKNVLTLLRAWTSLAADKRRAHPLVLAGDVDTPYGAEVRAEAQGLQPDTGSEAGAGSAGGPLPPVLFPGPIQSPELAGLYAGAVAFVFPSLIEGFGLPPLEAAACGVPVLASSAAPLPELLGDGAAYFDPRDPAALTRLMGEVLESDDLRRRLSARAQARARRFTWERAAADTLRAYRAARAADTPVAYGEEW